MTVSRASRQVRFPSPTATERKTLPRRGPGWKAGVIRWNAIRWRRVLQDERTKDRDADGYEVLDRIVGFA
jgi:hypothetical protein